MCETESRYAKYKPDNVRAKSRDICPGDALTLNDVPRIDARGKYRNAIDSKLSKSALAKRNSNAYQIESLPEADALIEACNLVLHANAESDADTDLAVQSKKSVSRVKSEAKEIARGLRAAIDELKTTRDYPESRRPEHTRTRNRGMDASRVRTDGGTVQDTFGRADVRETRGDCNKVVRWEAGKAVVCGNSAKYAVRAGGTVERRCGVHIADIEVLLE